MNRKHIEIINKRQEELERRLDRSWRPKSGGRVLRGGNIVYDVSSRMEGVSSGGLGLIVQLVKRLKVAERIDERVRVLKRHLPYRESDHVLNLIYNVMSGGVCLQDVKSRREDVSYLESVGARKIPAPSTEGDFLRRFKQEDVLALQEAFNESRLQVWQSQAAEMGKRATIDVDGTTAETTGCCKEGMDLNYKGQWGYGPLVVSLAETNEVLYTFNRPASRPAHEGAVAWIDRAVKLVRRGGFEQVRLRGDTDFSLTRNFDRWSEEGVEFVFGIEANRSFVREADKIGEPQWQKLERKRKVVNSSRQRPENVKQKVVRERGYKNLNLLSEHVTEIEYRPARAKGTYRMIILRKRIEVEKGQKRLFDQQRYLFYVTNVPVEELSTQQVVLDSNGRCNQENVIEQLKNGVQALRMPADTLVANWTYLVIAAQAWNLKVWLGLLLPARLGARRLIRMEFRRFVTCVIGLPCQIVTTGRRLLYRLLTVNDWTRLLIEGNLWLKHQQFG